MKINHLVLASTSPFRKALLERIGVQVSLAAPTADETLIHASRPADLALARSEAKGLSLAHPRTGCLAIAADQVMEFEGRAYGKPADRPSAQQQLSAMQGREHYLHSAYSLVYYAAEDTAPQLLCSRLVTAAMSMRSLGPEEIEAYLDTEEWRGCAGSYQFEHRGIHLFGEVVGDLDTIVGLPLRPLLQDLRTFGLNLLTHPLGPWELKI
jgi:septum formation protein